LIFFSLYHLKSCCVILNYSFFVLKSCSVTFLIFPYSSTNGMQSLNQPWNLRFVPILSFLSNEGRESYSGNCLPIYWPIFSTDWGEVSFVWRCTDGKDQDMRPNSSTGIFSCVNIYLFDYATIIKLLYSKLWYNFVQIWYFTASIEPICCKIESI
jgi:hypothetical protein